MLPVLFSGHMIDSPRRREHRFPPAKEPAVTSAIRNTLLGLPGGSVGLASGACGGDIIFHEQCALLNIPSAMYLAYPPEEFAENSVKCAGTQWEHRFKRLIDTIPVLILPMEYRKEIESVYVRTNVWMIDKALAISSNISLIALWDGKNDPGNEGGTSSMVDLLRDQGGALITIDIGLL